MNTKPVQVKYNYKFRASGREADENYRELKHRAEASICLARRLCVIDVKCKVTYGQHVLTEEKCT